MSLIGLPGSGKSTIARHLAARLHVKYVDSDLIIEKQLGCSIRDFFEREGEFAFREIEQTVVDQLTQDPYCVISTGGGVVLRQANREMLLSRCINVYLHCTPEEIFHRLKYDKKRPLLQVADPLFKLKDLYAERDPLYRETAEFSVETGRVPIPLLVTSIVISLKRGRFSGSHDK